MKFVVSVSKTYKHRGLHRHRRSTKKYWHIYYYDEDFQFRSKQVGYLKAMYYKNNLWKKKWMTCPDCRIKSLHFVKKLSDKELGKLECPDCYENFKDLYEEFLENLNS